MRSFEEICREFNKAQEKVESDLLCVLRVCTKHENLYLESPEYHSALVSFLHEESFISRGNPGNKLTPKGERAIKNGVVFYDIKEAQKRKRITLLKWLIPILISFIGLLVKVISIFIKKSALD